MAKYSGSLGYRGRRSQYHANHQSGYGERDAFNRYHLLGFGKHGGSSWINIPQQYLEYLAKGTGRNSEFARSELVARKLDADRLAEQTKHLKKVY